MTNGRGKSDSSTVPAKSPNKAVGPAAEAMEGKELAKGNSPERNALRTQGRESTLSALERVRQAARKDKKQRFTALLPLVLRKNSMDGIDPSFECSVFAVCTRCFTRRDRGVKLPRHPPSLPLCNSFHDGRGPCAPGRIGRENKSEGRSRKSQCGSGACLGSSGR